VRSEPPQALEQAQSRQALDERAVHRPTRPDDNFGAFKSGRQRLFVGRNQQVVGRKVLGNEVVRNALQRFEESDLHQAKLQAASRKRQLLLSAFFNERMIAPLCATTKCLFRQFDVDVTVMQYVLRVWPPGCAKHAVRPKILMHADNDDAPSIPVC
jgi:hypothetical protein